MIRIDENIIRKAIREALTESNGRLDDSFHELAEFILKKFYRLREKHKKGDEWSFNVTEREFSRFNGYYNVPFKALKINIVNHGGLASCGYNGDINVKTSLIYGDYEYAISTIEHELTHLVQNKMGSDKMMSNTSSLGCGYDDYCSYGINYCFDPQEMAARISGAYRFVKMQLDEYLADAYFAEWGEENPSFQGFYKEMWNALNDDNCWGITLSEMLHLDEMKIFIRSIEKESFKSFITAVRSNSGSLMAELLINNTPYYLRRANNGFFRILSNMYPYDDPLYTATDKELKNLFYFYKSRMLNYYKNAYYNYKKKIDKTLAPLAMEYFEKGMKEYN